MDIDLTILFQLTLFLVILVILTGALFRPLLKVIEARHQKIHGTKTEVDRLQRLAAENQDAYATRIREARNVARTERENLRAKGNDEKRRVLAEVRAEIAQALNETRERVSTAEAEASNVLSADTEELARRLVSKVIGREVTP